MRVGQRVRIKTDEFSPYHDLRGQTGVVVEKHKYAERNRGAWWVDVNGKWLDFWEDQLLPVDPCSPFEADLYAYIDRELRP